MLKQTKRVLSAMLCLLLLGACSTPSAEVSALITPTPEQSETASIQPTATPSVEAVPSASAAPTAEPTTAPSVSASAGQAAARKTAQPTVAPTPTPTPTPKATAKATPKATATPDANTITCTVSINCKAALASNADLANAVSKNGVILSGKKVKLKKGASVYDALAATGLPFGGSAGYVSSINSLGENDCGAGSGWMFCVNGKYTSKGSNQYTLQDGDAVTWNYTCDNGADIGAHF